MPTAGNTHEVAQARHPGAKVVYVDYEPVAVALGTRILRDNPDAVMVEADAPTSCPPVPPCGTGST
ncbi:SAM-dependent methyltransferase [Saccharothrix sp. S26]|nr:SAM-dependent methyltransferase [Saccharothrix sp. S26]MCE7000147.1 SAM-dependent methyltransferase [Saccharothrix sp. S26]